jgi:predicted acetylornithine/succinylornithine family transaminase
MDTVCESEIRQVADEYVLKTYAPALVLVRGRGAWVWDASGRRYLDFGTGISVCNLGHCHPRVTRAIRQQAARLVHVSNLYLNTNQPRLAKAIAENNLGGRVFFANSGAEANEGLIKFARRWGSEKGKFHILTMDGSFHGRTLATLAATGQTKYRRGFQPDVAGFSHAPFNDLDGVNAAIRPETVAILVEPVQGEGGVRPATPEFLRGLRTLCDARGLLLLFDEVQCGMGRTGRLFAHQHYGVTPDAMSMAKALGNGFPIGAFEVQRRYADVFQPGTHASTFGGTPLACAAAIAVLETFAAENVLENCRAMSELLRARLDELRSRHVGIRDIRGLGLMIGIELQDSVAPVMAAARERGLLVLNAGDTVLRLLPPLNVRPREIEFAVKRLDLALRVRARIT